MFENIGEKIKRLAVVICCIEFIAAIGAAIYCFSISTSNSVFIIIGMGSLIGGFLLSWASSLFIYGFGQLIENSEEIKENTAHFKYQSSIMRKKLPQYGDKPALRSGWKCPSCGMINDIDEETCECGTSQWDKPKTE